VRPFKVYLVIVECPEVRLAPVPTGYQYPSRHTPLLCENKMQLLPHYTACYFPINFMLIPILFCTFLSIPSVTKVFWRGRKVQIVKILQATFQKVIRIFKSGLLILLKYMSKYLYLYEMNIFIPSWDEPSWVYPSEDPDPAPCRTRSPIHIYLHIKRSL
jgi:hypothetical protein